MRRQGRRRQGATLVIVAASSLVLIGLVGLSIDVGYVYLSSHQLQNATDAAAMAGARVVRDDQVLARDEVLRIAAENFVAGDPLILDPNLDNEPGGDIVIGRYSRDTGEFIPGHSSPNAVQVIGRRNATSIGGQVALFFGGAFGVDGANIVRTATAKIGGGTGSGMIALGDSGCTVSFSGNAALVVDGGDIQVNSDADCAVCVSGQGTAIIVDAPNINVVGDACLNSAEFSGEVNPGSPPVDDPLANLPAPPVGDPMVSSQVRISQGDIVNLQPGYYPYGISITGGELNLAPGIYVIGRPTSGQGSGGQFPAGFNVGGGTVVGDNVMLYILDGAVDIGANVNVTLTPPDPDEYPFWPGSDTYEHVSIFQARDNTYNARIAGGPGLNISGTLYFPENHLILVGTGEGQFGNQILAQSYDFRGNGEITINYNGAFPAVGNIIFLVR